MKLYLIRIKAHIEFEFDCYDSFVIRANSEIEARKMAQDDSYDYRSDVFTNPENSTCEELLPEGASEIICGSFNAG